MKKLVIISLVCTLIVSSVYVQLNASEMINKDISKQNVEASYAPIHPNENEVEAVAATDLVVFDDPVFEQLVSDTLSVPVGEITVGDMETLTRLYNYERDEYSSITNINGIEYAVNLEDLQIQGTQLTNVSPVSGLTNLTELNLNGNEITDISPVSGLTNLTELNLNGNEITDISPVSGLINLTELNLNGNEITDISPVSEMTSLTCLYLGRNEITDISPVSGLTNLTELNLNGNEITDISPVSGLINLDYLSVGDNQITDISPVSGLTNLTTFHIYENQITDISPLSGLTNLTKGDFNNQEIVLEDITVVNNDEIFYEVTDINGEVHQVSLGVPRQPGTTTIFGEWDIDTSIGSFNTNFVGLFMQDVTYNPPMTGTDSASTAEETVLSDEALITLFELVSNIGEKITVDQSAVDYSKPGDYQVVFTDGSGNEFISTLTVEDVLPVIKVTRDQVTVTLGDSITDYIAEFGAVATEITDGDLTADISIDDSNVDYAVTGTHQVTFTVTDEEGNSTSKEVTVEVKYDPTIEVSPVTPEVDPNQAPVITESDEASYAPIHQNEKEVEATATDLVVFEDPVFEQLVSDELGVPVGEITVGDMETLTILRDDLGDYDYITNITGIEYADNLKTLYLESNQISDISALSGLTNLTSLSLEDNQISDISAVSGLTNLTSLDIANNQISDISPVSGLTNLTSLSLEDNQITDISAVSGLINLEHLGLEKNQITDISSVSELINLEYLGLGGNQITDISAVSELINLEYLGLGGNQITDISAVSGLINLKVLYIFENQISDISPISGLTNLVMGSFHSQGIYLEDITVSTNDEISYEVTDINGEVHQVSLGVPKLVTTSMHGGWKIDTSIGSVNDCFDGYFYQNVT